MAQNVNPFYEQQTASAAKEGDTMQRPQNDSHAVTKRYLS